MKVVGVILAGGRARRMGGGDKALAELAGRPLAVHVAARLSGHVAALALNANGDPARFAALGLPVLPDPLPGRPGPLAGVLAALDWAAGQGAAAAVTAPADTPFLPPDLVPRLRDASGEGARPALAAGPAGGLHPLCALWPVRLAPALRVALDRGAAKVRDFAAGQGAATVAFASEAAFFNVNTPEDLAAARAELAAR
ncbi:molybdenum cofactor guanylyltransferase MobA [Rhodosalinus sediminis]|uniref:Molybdenum cofactor guanylyltransferase n=1 Tax=Rhodosalinus sediminis TaxID=1940533 RepID=A0A3D9BWU8_9RHOB|nr:molybdenum cofactor guanylyltransferase MobA [Rhodosalinus sediminis]REC57994.1 molybdenum cofactor guanylyltransferase MobA [Rhodosalinus sediminis]